MRLPRKDRLKGRPNGAHDGSNQRYQAAYRRIALRKGKGPSNSRWFFLQKIQNDSHFVRIRIIDVAVRTRLGGEDCWSICLVTDISCGIDGRVEPGIVASLYCTGSIGMRMISLPSSSVTTFDSPVRSIRGWSHEPGRQYCERCSLPDRHLQGERRPNWWRCLVRSTRTDIAA
jgi:hypothetical protein